MGREGVPAWVIGALKWVAMIAVLALVVVYSAPRLVTAVTDAVSIETGGDDEPAPQGPEDEPEPIPGQSTIVGDVAVRSGAAYGVGAGAVELGTNGADELYLAFEPIPIDPPTCLTEVILRVRLVESDPTRLFAQPANLSDVGGYTEGDPLPFDSLIAGAGRVTAITNGSPGFLAWNITNQYALAASAAGDGEPVAVAILPDEIEDPEAEVNSVLAGAGAPENQHARLDWAATPNCPGAAAAATPSELPTTPEGADPTATPSPSPPETTDAQG
ncbi:hypothetical protein BH20ACT8_BH20ACT8_05180 [soil metagenome]